MPVIAHLITTSDEWSTRDIEETHVFSHLLPFIEFCWLDVAINLHMPLRWSHVLPKCHDVNVDLA